MTLGGSPLDFSDASGFDIPASVRVATTGAPASGFGYAALTIAGLTSLYLIDLANGAAQNLGAIGSGAVALAGLALGDAPSAPIITSDGGAATAVVAVAENNARQRSSPPPTATSTVTSPSSAERTGPLPDQRIERGTDVHRRAGLRSAGRRRPQQQLHRAGARFGWRLHRHANAHGRRHRRQ